MMQLARELKMLAKEFSLAVVVSVAAPCPSCATARSPGEIFEHLRGGTPFPAEQEAVPQCSAPHIALPLQPADVLFQQVWSKDRAALLPAFVAVLSQQVIHLIEQGSVKYRQTKRLFVFSFDYAPFI